MLSKLNRNGVLTGYVDSFCLVCQTAFRSNEDASEHIELPMHLENLNNYPYLDKYKDDHIRKVKSGYFCEYCNVLEPTATKIVLHIADTKHSYAKNSQMLTLRGGNVQFGNILVSNEAWNGLKEDSCMICNVEFDNISIHKTEKDHVLKLVQSKVEFGENGFLYRKMDSDTFQCLTCNSMLDLKAKTNHCEYPEHTKLYNDSKIENSEQHNKLNKKENMNNDISRNRKGSTAKPIDELLSDHKFNDELLNKVVGNGQNNKKVQKEKVTPYDNEPASQNNEHSSASKDIALKQEHSVSDVEEARLFAIENKLTYNSDNNNAHCRICKNKFPSSLRSMKEHVDGKVHQKNVSLEEAIPKYTVELTRRFLVHYLEIHNNNGDENEIVVNDKFLMNEKSFQLIAIVSGRFRCYMCEVNVHPSEFKQHIFSDSHKKIILSIPVVTSLNTEFVREVRPGIFHCGFCDVIVSSWSDLESHLKCSQHEAAKGYFEFELCTLRPQLDQYWREKRASEFFKFMTLMNVHNLL